MSLGRAVALAQKLIANIDDRCVGVETRDLLTEVVISHVFVRAISPLKECSLDVIDIVGNIDASAEERLLPEPLDRRDPPGRLQGDAASVHRLSNPSHHLRITLRT